VSHIDGGLRRLFQEHLPHLHWQSIETGLTGRGVPDSNFCSDGTEGWIEFKWTAAWGVDLRPEQVGWHMRRARAGGLTRIAVRQQCAAGPRRGPAVDALWLLRGSFAADIRSGGLRHLPSGSCLGQWHNGPANWDWPLIGRLLLAA
jgi:hypothetical protein